MPYYYRGFNLDLEVKDDFYNEVFNIAEEKKITLDSALDYIYRVYVRAITEEQNKNTHRACLRKIKKKQDINT